MVSNSLSRTGLTWVAALVMFTIGALLVSLAPGAASAGTTLSVTGGTANVGGTMSSAASVSVAAPDELNAFDVTISYNASVVVPTSVTLNSAWTIPLDAGTIGPGTIHVAASRLGFCTGTCPLFTVNWNAVGSGSVPLSPSNYVLSGRQSGVAGNITQTSVSAGTLTVNGQQTATNTPVTPATNTPVTPGTNTPVAPATSTPVTPAATSTPVTPATGTAVAPVTSTAATTNTPVTAVSTAAPSSTAVAAPLVQTPAPEPTDTGAAPPPAEPTPAAPSSGGPTDPPDTPAPASPAPVVNAPALPRANAPAGAAVPLPPRTGSSAVQGATGSPWLPLGWILMALSGVLVVGEYIRSARDRHSAFSLTVSGYLDEVEREPRRRN
jgi:hypothetical protein